MILAAFSQMAGLFSQDVTGGANLAGNRPPARTDLANISAALNQRMWRKQGQCPAHTGAPSESYGVWLSQVPRRFCSALRLPQAHGIGHADEVGYRRGLQLL